jgi:hypothetical protein
MLPDGQAICIHASRELLAKGPHEPFARLDDLEMVGIAGLD